MGLHKKYFLDRPPKRGRTEVSTSHETHTTPPRFPKFLVLHSESDKQLSKMSPFLVAKVLEGVIGKNFKAKKLASGDLLVEIETSHQSSALLALNCVSDYKVTVTPHKTLNTIQGVISEDDLLDASESEVVEGLSDQGVVAARRISLRRDGQELKTRHIVLTFEATTLPESVKAGYLFCRVRPYVPNPRRCFNCQRFGHGSQNCRGKATCAKCGKTDHAADSCSNDAVCVNCKEPHPAYSRSCKTWKDEKEILTLKVKENLSYPEARRRFAFLRKGGSAQVVQRGPAPLKVAVATQTSFPDARKPLQSPTPQLKLQHPGRSLSAGRPTSSSSESCSSSTGQQPVPSHVEGSQAVSLTEDGSAVSAPVSASRSPSKERGPRSRPNSSEGASSSKERHDSCATAPTPKEQEQVGLGDCLPSTSAPPVGGGRGRGVPPRAQSLPKPARTASAQEAEPMEEGADPSTPASDPDDMEWQVPKGKHKSKKPIVPPK
ncbi:hypothetical protein ISCGN_011354 [Ixodes scapularis]